MNIIATHINYLHICHRKLWLFANGISMEHTSDLVYEGKMIGEKTYPQRAEKYRELEIDGVKIDFYDAKNKVVHEIKKSSSYSEAHVAQVKYYLYILKRNGVEGATGILEYPKLHKRETVILEEGDDERIANWVKKATEIIAQEDAPPTIQKSKCKKCSYYDFCWITETPEE
jgi:CRISPR-associated exonuclease Cas4